jgi:hypothetical protein
MPFMGVCIRWLERPFSPLLPFIAEITGNNDRTVFVQDQLYRSALNGAMRLTDCVALCLFDMMR